jgi:signal transduction histidine kinase
MTQAVKNERLAVRQKLIDVYTKRAQNFFVDVPALYFDSKIEHLNSLSSQESYLIFDAFAIPPGDQFAGMLIFDANDNFAYPILDVFATHGYEQLTEPFQNELAGNVEEAIEQYKKIVEEAASETARYKASLSIARCLDTLDKKQEAIELAHKLSYPANPEAVESELAAVVMHSRVFLAGLYKEIKDENLYYHIRRILGNSRYNNEKESGFLDGPAETIIWQLDKLINIAVQAGLSDKLQRQIISAKSRIEAYQNAIWAASIYPDAKVLNTWPDQTIRKLSPESDMYGLKFKLGDKTILGLSSADRMLKILNAGVSDTQDDTISVQVYNNLGQFIAGDNNLANKPFLTLSPGQFFPDFKVAIHFKDNSVFENAASKQTTIYTWTGVLVVLLILASGAIAAQVIGRQIKLNRLKNNFIATVTHELKTPLSSMRVLVDTLLEGNYNDQQQATEYLQLISKENVRLSRLIDNFLTFSRMERNKQAFDIVLTNPAEISKAAAEAVQTKFNHENCKFTVTIDDNLPSIMADKDAMVTVLVNLLDNAYKYTNDDKQIEMKVFSENKSVCFAVKDNGIGMTRRQTRKIFDRFYQADSSLSRQAEGTGLGLSIVKFIVGAHKGTISVGSKPDQGTTFIVKLTAVI